MQTVNIYVTGSLFTFQPAVQLICVRRSDSSITEFGTNKLAEWKPDSSMIAVLVSLYAWCSISVILQACLDFPCYI